MQIGKEFFELSLFADDMILCIGEPNDFTKRLLELTCEFSQVSGYKINMYKSVMFLYTESDLSKKELMRAIPCIIATKN